ncbi:oligosaccharide flippase family protein [candidate division KSB1 bacterium]|nr:oligosaccharide flippase family protein [candidate division KSB1 bacterium]
MKQHFKRLSKHTIIYGLGDVIIKAIAFILIPLYTEHLTPADYGELSLLQAIEIVLPIILSFGFNSAILKVFHDYEDQFDRQEVVSTALIFILIIALPICLLLFNSASFFARLIRFNSPEAATYYLQLIFISAFFSLFRLTALSVLRAYEQGIHYTVINIIHFTLLVSMNILFVAILKQKVAGIVQSSAITSAVVFLGITTVMIKRIRLSFSRQKLRELLAFGLPLVPGGLAVWTLTLADRYLLKFLSTTEEVGLYEIGYKFGMMLNMLLIHPFRTAWLPFMFSIQKDAAAKRIYSVVLTYFLCLAAWLWLGISALGHEAVILFTKPAFYAGYQSISLIALANLFYGVYYTVDVGVLVKGKTTAYAAITAIGALIDIALAYFLIPDFGMMGAAFAKVLAYAVLASLMYVVSQKYYPINYEISRILKLLVLTAIIYWITTLIQLESIWHNIIIKVVLLLLFPVLLFLIGFFTDREKKVAGDFMKKVTHSIRRRNENPHSGETD